MVTLSDALAAEREKRRNLEEDGLARKQVARAVLSSLADKLNATSVSGWAFALEDQAIRMFHTVDGPGTKLAPGPWTTSCSWCAGKQRRNGLRRRAMSES
jgi:hypothetical protein